MPVYFVYILKFLFKYHHFISKQINRIIISPYFIGGEHNIYAEIDVFLENGDAALAVEVKTRANTADVREYVERMQKLRRYFDLHNDRRALYGAVAANPRECPGFRVKAGFLRYPAVRGQREYPGTPGQTPGLAAGKQPRIPRRSAGLVFTCRPSGVFPLNYLWFRGIIFTYRTKPRGFCP
jgi:hypothetical protein